MPAKTSKKRKYSKYGKRMEPAAYQIGKVLSRELRARRALSNYASIGNYLSDQGTLSVPYVNPQGLSIPDTMGTYLSRKAALGKGRYTWGNVARSAAGSIAHELGADRGAGRKIGGLLYRTGNRYAGGGGYIPTGRGSYSGPGENVNSLISGGNVSVPEMAGGDEIGSVVIAHKEYLGSITGSKTFENTIFQLNPGLVSTFPWLSQIAVNYEEYSFEQLMFTYSSLLSDATASGAVGQIIMTTNYNAGNPPFSSTTDMLNNIGTISARPIDSPIIHGVECDDNKNVLPSYFVRVGAVPSGQDIKTYDVGLFQLATEGMPENDALQGQLWVSYTITLRKPKLFTAAGKGILEDVFRSFGGFSGTKLTGTPLYYSSLNTIGCTLSNPGTNIMRIQFPSQIVQGLFKIRWSWVLPRNGANVYPPTPQLTPAFTFSNCQQATNSLNAEFGNLDNYNFQQTGYAAVTANDLVQIELHVQLLGSFAIPTYIDISFAQLVGAFGAARMNCSIVQVNPRLTATTNSAPPPEWLSLAL